MTVNGVENKMEVIPGDNLLPAEINLVTNLIGKERRCLCRAIAQVAIDRSSFLGNNFPLINHSAGKTSNFIAQSKTSFKWQIILKLGVIAFTHDLEQKKYYIQAIDMDSGLVILNHIIETHVVFQRRRRFIVIFETEIGTICLNFVDDDEADHFAGVLHTFMSKYNPTSKPDEIKKSFDSHDSDNAFPFNKVTQDQSQNQNISKEMEHQNGIPNCSSKHDKQITEDIVDMRTKKHSTLANKLKDWFSIRGSSENLFKKSFSKQEFREKIGYAQFEKLLIFIKVAGMTESDFDDPMKAKLIVEYYESNKNAIEMVEPERAVEYGTIEDVFGEYYEENTDSQTEQQNKSINNINICPSIDSGDIFLEYYDDNEDHVNGLSDPAPALPPRLHPVSNQPKFALPPKPVKNMQKENASRVNRQISRPGRPAPPPPSAPLTPSSLASPSGYANTRDNLLKSIRERKEGYLRPVNNKLPRVPPNSPNPPTGSRQSLRAVLNNALKKIHEVNVSYGDEPDMNSYWDDE